MRFLRVHLRAAAERMADMRAFYAGALELPVRPSAQDSSFETRIGETELAFTAGASEPFYHFALLLPGDRFDAALAWASGRVSLLPHADSGELAFDFPAWNARACYFHDPAGNIVELIAHRDREASGVSGAFAATELIGLSELGLVGQPTAMAPPLTDRLGLPVWDGQVADHDALAFVGAPARTLILVPTGRGWLPTGRPGERHPADVVLAGPAPNPADAHELTLEDDLYRISRSP